jgi:hypothetical protein
LCNGTFLSILVVLAQWPHHRPSWYPVICPSFRRDFRQTLSSLACDVIIDPNCASHSYYPKSSAYS